MKRNILSLALALVMLVVCGGQALAQTERPDLLGDFETTDIYGEAVDQNLIQDAKLTFINIWGTYCPPCIEEMPDLGKLAEEYKGRVQFVGLVVDANNGESVDQSVVDLAKQIVEQSGAGTYKHVIAPTSWVSGFLGSVQFVPTSFFVDSEGRQVSYAVQTAQSADDWRTTIDTVLAEIEG